MNKAKILKRLDKLKARLQPSMGGVILLSEYKKLYEDIQAGLRVPADLPSGFLLVPDPVDLPTWCKYIQYYYETGEIHPDDEAALFMRALNEKRLFSGG